MRWLWMVCAIFLALLVSFRQMPATPVPDPGEAGPYPTGSYSITTTNAGTGSTLETVLYYPASGGTIDPAGAPYAAIVFAHGFMASPSSYPGNAEHLASWGYIVALPDLPDDNTEVRQSDARHILSYLTEANGDPASPLYGMVDTARLGVTGHSLGGLTAMIAAARDPRVRAAVALDPTNPDPIMGSDPWDYAAEAPNTTAPLLVLGAPSQMCNSNANYNPMYDNVGSTHRAKLVLTDASHCDFMVTDSDLHILGCTLFCGGSYEEARVTLIQRSSTAWFNYYLRGETEFYPYIYGIEAEADVTEGRIVERDVRTNVRGASAVAEGQSIRLAWTASGYAVVAGYNVYRGTTSGQYAAQPYAQVGQHASYLDTDVQAGQRYYYILRSRDAAGNEHGASTEVSAATEPVAPPAATQTPGMPPTTEPPDPTPTPTQDRTLTYLPLLNR